MWRPRPVTWDGATFWWTVDPHLLVLELQVNGDAETAVRQALYRQYGLAMVRKGQAIMVMGLNIDTHQRSITACACWELGVFDVATGHWAHEPFELPLQQVRSNEGTRSGCICLSRKV